MQSLISSGVNIEGSILLEGALHLEGCLRGKIVAGSLGEPELVVGPGGKVEGSIRVPVVTIFGTVTGTVVASRSLTLMPGARVDGELFYGALSIRKGALVTGTLVNGDEGRARAQRVEPSQDPEPSAEYSEHPTLSTA